MSAFEEPMLCWNVDSICCVRRVAQNELTAEKVCLDNARDVVWKGDHSMV